MVTLDPWDGLLHDVPIELEPVGVAVDRREGLAPTEVVPAEGRVDALDQVEVLGGIHRPALI